MIISKIIKKSAIIFFYVIIVFPVTLFSQHHRIVKTGLEVLKNRKFDILYGKRVGLITNQTGTDQLFTSTIDLFRASGRFSLVSLYSPEHGIRGEKHAGEDIKTYRDEKTGIIVHSLYGLDKEADIISFDSIDVLVYDIQDIGCRSYTFIGLLGKAITIAAKKNIQFIVLDRPNPLGGEKVEGSITEKEFLSGVSPFAIPYIYGLTPGELAIWLNEEMILGVKCNLKVIAMEGWKRSMTYEDTGLKWIPTSPQIPTMQTALYYPCSGILGELQLINIGIGYTLPFQIFGADWIDADSMAEAMNNLHLKGIMFRPINYKPFFGSQVNKNLHGVQIYITDFRKLNLMAVQFLILQECHRLYPNKHIFPAESRNSMFDKVCGTDKIRDRFFKQFNYEDIKNLIEDIDKNFVTSSKKYHIYK